MSNLEKIMSHSRARNGKRYEMQLWTGVEWISSSWHKWLWSARLFSTITMFTTRLVDHNGYATHVPVQEEPNDDREAQYVAGYLHTYRVTDPDTVAFDKAVALSEQRQTLLEERDAAIERVRAIHYNIGESQGYSSQFKGGYGILGDCCAACGTPGEYGVEWPCPTVVALDGAPEPETDPEV